MNFESSQPCVPWLLGHPTAPPEPGALLQHSVACSGSGMLQGLVGSATASNWMAKDAEYSGKVRK